ETHAAAGERRQVVVVAQVRDVDAVLDRGVQDGLALGRLDLAAVDRQLDPAPLRALVRRCVQPRWSRLECHRSFTCRANRATTSRCHPARSKGSRQSRRLRSLAALGMTCGGSLPYTLILITFASSIRSLLPPPCVSAAHTPAGQRWSRMCASSSSRKWST